MATEKYQPQVVAIQPTQLVPDTANMTAAEGWNRFSQFAGSWMDLANREMQQDAITAAERDAAQVVQYDGNGAVIPPTSIEPMGGGPIYRRSYMRAAEATYLTAASNSFANKAREVSTEFPTNPEMVGKLLADHAQATVDKVDPLIRNRVSASLNAIRAQAVSGTYAASIAQTNKTISEDADRELSAVSIDIAKSGATIAKLTGADKAAVLTPTETLYVQRLDGIRARWKAAGMVDAEIDNRIERGVSIGVARATGKRIGDQLIGLTGPDADAMRAQVLKEGDEAAKGFGKYEPEARAVINNEINLSMQRGGYLDAEMRGRDGYRRTGEFIKIEEDKLRYGNDGVRLGERQSAHLAEIMADGSWRPESRLALMGALSGYRNPAVAAGYQDLISEARSIMVSPNSEPHQKATAAATIEALTRDPAAQLAMGRPALDAARGEVEQYRMASVYAGSVPDYAAKVDRPEGVSPQAVAATRAAWTKAGIISATPGRNQISEAQFEAMSLPGLARHNEFEKARNRANDAWGAWRNDRLMVTDSQKSDFDKHIPDTPLMGVNAEGKTVEVPPDGKNPDHRATWLFDLARKGSLPKSAKEWAAQAGTLASSSDDKLALQALRNGVVEWYRNKTGLSGEHSYILANQFVEGQLGSQAVKLLRAADRVGPEDRIKLGSLMDGESTNADSRQAGGGPVENVRDRLRQRWTGESSTSLYKTTGITGFFRAGFDMVGIIGNDNLDAYIGPMAAKSGIYWSSGSKLNTDPSTLDRILERAELELKQHGEVWSKDGKDRDLTALKRAMEFFRGETTLRREKDGSFTMVYRSLEGEMANVYGRPVSQQQAINEVLTPFTLSERLQDVDPKSVSATPYTANGKTIHKLTGYDRYGTMVEIGEVDLSQPSWDRRFIESRNRAIADLKSPGLFNTLNGLMNGMFDTYLSTLNAEKRAAIMSGAELPKGDMLEIVHGLRERQRAMQNGRLSVKEIDAFAKLEADPEALTRLLKSDAFQFILHGRDAPPQYGPNVPVPQNEGLSIFGDPTPTIESGRAPSITGNPALRPTREGSVIRMLGRKTAVPEPPKTVGPFPPGGPGPQELPGL